MAIEIKRKQDEPMNSFLYRFNKMIQQSGILRQSKSGRFRVVEVNRNRRRTSAVYRAKIKKQIQSMKKSGVLKGTEDITFIKKLLRDPKKPKSV
jgi:ribosomal protein S21